MRVRVVRVREDSEDEGDSEGEGDIGCEWEVAIVRGVKSHCAKIVRTARLVRVRRQ